MAGDAPRLLLIPTPIAADAAIERVLPQADIARVAALGHFVAESARTARAFLKRLPLARPLQQIAIAELNEHTAAAQVPELLAPLRAGHDLGLVSEAGCPGIADPGAALVLEAHREGFQVEPLVGPSALLLALMASGLNGQRFAFAGYLPADAAGRTRALRDLETRSASNDETQLLIETPYRNQAMLDAMLQALRPDTLLSIATDIGGTHHRIATRSVADWRARPPTLARAPAVFLLLARAAAPPRGGGRPRPR